VFAGNAADTYRLRVEITTGGSQATAVYRWSSDDGLTWTTGVTASPTATMLGTTGVTVAFPTGTYTLGNVFSVSVQSLVTKEGQTSYDLPEDFYKIQSVMVKGTGWPYPVWINQIQRLDDTYLDSPAVTPTKYGLINSRTGRAKIKLYPKPQAGISVLIKYFPTAPRFATTASTIDTLNGWGDQYAEYYGAMQCAMKDEHFDLVDRLGAYKDTIAKRIRGVAANGRSADATQVQNVWGRRRRYW
jgi:hypothetical protein